MSKNLPHSALSASCDDERSRSETPTMCKQKNPPRRRPTPPWVLALFVLLASCASSSTRGTLYLHANADLGAYQRVAILQLENLAIDRTAGDRIRDILLVELAAQGLFDVVDTGEVNRVMRLAGFADATELGPEELLRIGEALEVQALVLGTLLEYRDRRSGSITAPEIALSLRLLDVETGLTVWSVSDARTGASLSTRLFGLGERSLSQASRELVRRMIRTLTYGG